MPTPHTYVFVHGFWHGAWCWRRVIERLQAQGHRTHALSYTGMGDRAHLLHESITIDTFVDDIAGVIESEELEEVILVAHSFGGIPATGVAARLPQLLRHLVYLDAALVESGQAAFNLYPPAEAQARRDAARDSGGLAVPAPAGLPPAWGLAPGSPDYDWVMRRLTPHPLGSGTTPLHYSGPIGNGVPTTYIECTAPVNPLSAWARARAQAMPGWNYVRLAAPHEAMLTHPAEVTRILLNLC
jgi:pimeloyl-ACP methyl ester carboxylesterase